MFLNERIMIRTGRKVKIWHFSSKEFCIVPRISIYCYSNATVATSGIDGTFDCDPEIPLASHVDITRYAFCTPAPYISRGVWIFLILRQRG